jgi:hypothetical protein
MVVAVGNGEEAFVELLGYGLGQLARTNALALVINRDAADRSCRWRL